MDWESTRMVDHLAKAMEIQLVEFPAINNLHSLKTEMVQPIKIISKHQIRLHQTVNQIQILDHKVQIVGHRIRTQHPMEEVAQRLKFQRIVAGEICSVIQMIVPSITSVHQLASIDGPVHRHFTLTPI